MVVTSLKRERWEHCSNTVAVKKIAEFCLSTFIQTTITPQAVM
jgi:hypothetical protein